ncbi:glycosyltransferase family 2 protein [PVC group bacterium]|nr:glycosyltransferase family 2 protein [PVC group bacterium]
MIRFLIPAYNEEKNLRVLLKRIDTLMKEDYLDYHVLIIDDGSRDNTLGLIEEYRSEIPVRVVSHPTNYGVDQAFRTGFREILKECEPRDIVITMEADNTSDIHIMEKMIAKIGSGDDLVLASCYAKGGGVEGTTRFRLFLSACANGLLKTFFPIKGVNTYSSFYRAYRSETLKKAFQLYGDHFIEEKGFVCMVEMLIKFHRMNLRISEVPMVLKGQLRDGQSKMKIFPTVLGYCDVIRRNFLRRNWTSRSKNGPK